MNDLHTLDTLPHLLGLKGGGPGLEWIEQRFQQVFSSISPRPTGSKSNRDKDEDGHSKIFKSGVIPPRELFDKKFESYVEGASTPSWAMKNKFLSNVMGKNETGQQSQAPAQGLKTMNKECVSPETESISSLESAFQHQPQGDLSFIPTSCDTQNVVSHVLPKLEDSVSTNIDLGPSLGVESLMLENSIKGENSLKPRIEIPGLAACVREPCIAERMLSYALDRFPTSPDINCIYADFHYFVKENSDFAIELYRKGLHRSPDHLPSVSGLAIAIAESMCNKLQIKANEFTNASSYEELKFICETWLCYQTDDASSMYAYSMWLQYEYSDISTSEKVLRRVIELCHDEEHNMHPHSICESTREWILCRESKWVLVRALCDLAVLVNSTAHDLSQAETLIRDALLIDSNHSKAHYLLGCLLQYDVSRSEESERSFRNAIQICPTNHRALCNLANLVYRWKGDQYEAERLFLSALRLDPEDSESLQSYAILLDQGIGDYKGAMEMCERALAIDPFHVPTLACYARILQDEMQDHARAENIYKQILSVDLQCVDVLYNYGRLLLEVKGDWPAAERMYRRALQANPRHIPTLCNLGLLLEEYHRDFEGAEFHYKTALEVDANDQAALYNYGVLLQNVKCDYDAAEEIYKRLLRLEPQDKQTLHVYANLLFDVKKNIPEAEELYTRAIKINDTDPALLCDYGRLLHSVGRNLEAEEKYRRVLRMDENHEIALRNYASLLHDDLQNYDQAELLYKKILSNSPSTTSKASAFCNLARLLQDVRRDYDSAESLYLQAIKYGVMDFRSMHSYAVLLDDIRGRYSEATIFYRKMMRHNPEVGARELYAIARKKKETGDIQTAIEVLSFILEEKSFFENSQILQEIANLTLLRHDYKDASQFYVRSMRKDPSAVASVSRVALDFQNQKNHLAALELYKGILEVKQDDSLVCLRLGQVLFALHEEGRVPADSSHLEYTNFLRRALELDPNLCDHVYILGVKLEAKEDFLQAVALYRMNAIASEYAHSKSLVQAAMILHHKLHSNEEAGFMYEKAVMSGVQESKFFLSYGKYNEKFAMNNTLAMECYRAAELIEPTNIDTLISIARMATQTHPYVSREYISRAIVLYSDERLLETGSEFHMDSFLAQLLIELSRVSKILGDIDHAEEILLQVLDAYPLHTEAMTEMALLLREMGQDAHLQEILVSRLVELNVNNSAVWCLHGKLLMNKAVSENSTQNGIRDALCAFNQALDLKPNDVDALFEVAALSAWEGNHEKAVTLLERILVEDPLQHKAMVAYTSMVTENHCEHAASIIQEALKRDRQNYDARKLSAKILLLQGRLLPAFIEVQGLMTDKPSDIEVVNFFKAIQIDFARIFLAVKDCFMKLCLQYCCCQILFMQHSFEPPHDGFLSLDLQVEDSTMAFVNAQESPWRLKQKNDISFIQSSMLERNADSYHSSQIKNSRNGTGSHTSPCLLQINAMEGFEEPALFDLNTPCDLKSRPFIVATPVDVDRGLPEDEKLQEWQSAQSDASVGQDLQDETVPADMVDEHLTPTLGAEIDSDQAFNSEKDESATRNSDSMWKESEGQQDLIASYNHGGSENTMKTDETTQAMFSDDDFQTILCSDTISCAVSSQNVHPATQPDKADAYGDSSIETLHVDNVNAENSFKPASSHKSPITIRCIQNGFIDEFRKPRMKENPTSNTYSFSSESFGSHSRLSGETDSPSDSNSDDGGSMSVYDADQVMPLSKSPSVAPETPRWKLVAQQKAFEREQKRSEEKELSPELDGISTLFQSPPTWSARQFTEITVAKAAHGSRSSAKKSRLISPRRPRPVTASFVSTPLIKDHNQNGFVNRIPASWKAETAQTEEFSPSGTQVQDVPMKHLQIMDSMFTALRGVAFRSRTSRAEKFKIYDSTNRVVGVGCK
ncbi:hypothetical protein GUITHDRAFT_105840 [Guillardia theta CCMP2712]|uniref:Uncharacterized protein n=1 Tax=Guillardia theta (strain CCMP2712) TaxID=905079 RepID=L1JIU0_GUITC|nr:hypothetical protein GUITHDRAFT_105840 [Guillardia theta CCMP2712]EKX48232.1 hypothetical protein GUITHDRAFT_105840 [Guillardia theta CCMP2712]|eukprot:XP_005835212.1 hypothetical protein GUITHDRAFT_105840 [Guillardia theta CCMP2712]